MIEHIDRWLWLIVPGVLALSPLWIILGAAIERVVYRRCAHHEMLREFWTDPDSFIKRRYDNDGRKRKQWTRLP
jgi:hypothetical protein